MRGVRTHVSNLTKLTFRYSVTNRLILNHLTKFLRTHWLNKRKYTSNEYIVCLSSNTLNSTVTIQNNITINRTKLFTIFRLGRTGEKERKERRSDVRLENPAFLLARYYDHYVSRDYQRHPCKWKKQKTNEIVENNGYFSSRKFLFLFGPISYNARLTRLRKEEPFAVCSLSRWRYR